MPIDKKQILTLYIQSNTIGSIGFEWNSDKNETNYKKHSIWFEEAQTIWTDITAVELLDSEHSDTEDRYLRIGHSSSRRILLVVFCEREKASLIRIISARRATPREIEAYEEGI